MGSADCRHYAGSVETPKICFKRKPGPLSDTLQAGACVFPPPVPIYGSIWVVLWLLFFRSAPSTFPQRTGHLFGAISGSPYPFRLHSKLARTILALKLSVTTKIKCQNLWHFQICIWIQIFYFKIYKEFISAASLLKQTRWLTFFHPKSRNVWTHRKKMTLSMLSWLVLGTKHGREGLVDSGPRASEATQCPRAEGNQCPLFSCLGCIRLWHDKMFGPSVTYHTRSC